MDTCLVGEVDHSSSTTTHECKHHPLALISRGQMSLDKDKYGYGKRSASEIVLRISVVQDEPNELDGKADPEE